MRNAEESNSDYLPNGEANIRLMGSELDKDKIVSLSLLCEGNDLSDLFLGEVIAFCFAFDLELEESTDGMSETINIVQDMLKDNIVTNNNMIFSIFPGSDYTMAIFTYTDSENSTNSSQKSSHSLGEKNALESAKSYLNVLSFSYSGLVKQLEHDGFSHSEAIYAVDNCNADWNEQAAESAKDYLNVLSMSRQELVNQLIHDGFTTAQAEYGVTAVGY